MDGWYSNEVSWFILRDKEGNKLSFSALKFTRHITTVVNGYFRHIHAVVWGNPLTDEKSEQVKFEIADTLICDAGTLKKSLKFDLQSS